MTSLLETGYLYRLHSEIDQILPRIYDEEAKISAIALKNLAEYNYQTIHHHLTIMFKRVHSELTADVCAIMYGASTTDVVLKMPPLAKFSDSDYTFPF